MQLFHLKRHDLINYINFQYKFLPVATWMAVGVAKPRAQGHATTNTETAAETALLTGKPAAIHPINVALLMLLFYLFLLKLIE